jgi:hypothetical protein
MTMEVYDVAIQTYIAELISIQPPYPPPWPAADLHNVVLVTHDQLECLVYAVPMEDFYTNRYRRMLKEYKKLMEELLKHDPAMTKEMILAYHERLRPYQDRLGPQ